jgi:alpha-tubulin suppressor-like RCC1 family protein
VLTTASNNAPALSSATLGDGPFTVEADITVSLGDATDPEGDTVSFTYAWSINGTPVSGAQEKVLTKDQFKRGDVVVCTVTPNDGKLDGEPVSSAEVTIGNVVPVLAGASIGSGPYGVEDVITAIPDAVTDADGDTITYTYRWFVDGNEVAGQTEASLLGSHFSKGQAVRVEVTPHDGVEAGAPVESNSVTIQNTAPVLASAALGSGPYRIDDTVTVTPGVPTDADGDAITLSYRWFVNGVEEPGANGTSLAGAFIRGDAVYAEVTPNDGETDGAAVYSAAVTIVNTAPVVTSADLGSGPHRKASTITASPMGSDADNDTVFFSVRWYVNGSYVSTGASLSGSFAKGNTVAAEVTPNDSLTDGARLWTAPVTIQDTAPVMTSVSLTEPPVYTYTTLNATASASDADGETVTYTYRWLINGTPVPGATSSSFSGPYVIDDLVAVEVTPHAGGVAGTPLTSAAAVIVTGPPSVPGVGIFPANVGAGGPNMWAEVVTASVNPDGGSVTYSYTWFRNDVAQGFSSSTTLVTGANIAGGDVWRVEVIASSGIKHSNPGEASKSILHKGMEIASGNNHTCSLTTDNGVVCWGSNSNGELGDGTNTKKNAAVQVAGLASGVQAVVTGYFHSCALTDAGGVKCWGANGNGQLGDGTTEQRLTPVDVSGLTSGVIAIAAGHSHTCAVTTGGGVKCWGNNASGQLGDEGNMQRLTPVDTSGLGSGVASVASRYHHTCAVMTGGAVKCWGANGSGQLGNNSNSTAYSPVDVSGLTSGVAEVTMGQNHTCAVLTTGGVKCWGYNGLGQLGDGSMFSAPTPVNVSGLASGAVAAAAGSNHTCVLTDAGAVKCWGANFDSQLGDGTQFTRYSPVAVNNLTSGVQAVAAGNNHSCAVLDSGSVKCWGNNTLGQLSTGNATWRETPVTANASIGAQAVGVGQYHTCSVTGGGGVECWGYNGFGQLGDDTYVLRLSPVNVSGLSNVAAVANGQSHTCARTGAGGAKCWGRNSFGQLGDGSNTERITPVDVSGLTSGVAAIATRQSHTCALTSTGGVKCWGLNSTGQLGDASTTQRAAPVDVSGLSSGVSAIAVGQAHTCALTDTGGVKCWGDNGNGQLGDGTNSQRTTPVNVSGLTSGVTAIATGSNHTCAVTSAGALKCWGGNWEAQLGDGTTTPRSAPVSVSGLDSGVQAVSAGLTHTCALTDAGGVKCWGKNANGQVGDGSTTQRTTPANVSGLASGVEEVVAGYNSTCAFTDVGLIKCWGDNSYGQLGDLTPETAGWVAELAVLGFWPD